MQAAMLEELMWRYRAALRLRLLRRLVEDLGGGRQLDTTMAPTATTRMRASTRAGEDLPGNCMYCQYLVLAVLATVVMQNSIALRSITLLGTPQAGASSSRPLLKLLTSSETHRCSSLHLTCLA